MRRAAFILLACAGACGGGGGETCTGVGDAGVAGATITAGGETFVYGNFDWGFNNDCGMRSITIQGGQVTPPAQGFGIGLCVPVVERIGSGPATLADRNVVELVGASASNGDCSFLPSAGAMPSGTVTFGGFCTEPGASFTVTFAGQISGTRSCTSGGAPQPVTIQLGGTALVSPRP
jgi:hypothetical protein